MAAAPVLLAACEAAYRQDHNRPYPPAIIGQLREAIELAKEAPISP